MYEYESEAEEIYCILTTIVCSIKTLKRYDSLPTLTNFTSYGTFLNNAIMTMTMTMTMKIVCFDTR